MEQETKTLYYVDGIPVESTCDLPTSTYISSTASAGILHAHEYMQMLYVDYGSVAHDIFDTTYKMSPREIILIPPMHKHSVSACDCNYRMAGCDILPSAFTSESGNPWSFDSVCLTPLSVTAHKKVPFMTVRPSTAQELSSLFDECFALSNSDSKDTLLLRGKTIEMISLVASEFSNCEGALIGSKMADYCPSLYKAMHCIHKGFREELSVERIARDSMLQERTLYRLFNGCMNTSILQYITHLRLCHAKKLLSETDRILSDIAVDSGFKHQSNFHRLFLRQTGMSPTQYRKAYAAVNIE